MKDLQIIKLKAEELFEIEDISIKKRTDEYIIARAAYYFVAKKKTNHSLDEIGSFINKNHATVIHAIKKIDEYDLNFKGFKHKLSNLMMVNVKPFEVLYDLISEVSINEVEDVIESVRSVLFP